LETTATATDSQNINFHIKAAKSAFDSFIYALDSPAARRQYPKRLKIFLKFAGMPGKTVEEQAAAFLAKNDIRFIKTSLSVSLNTIKKEF
jgi:hypothetical protein